MNQNHKCLKGSQPLMEEDLEILKVDYLNNHSLDLPQILTLNLGTWIKITCLKGRQPPMEEDPKMLKFEYLSNHGSDIPQIWKPRVSNQNKKCSK